MVDRWVLQTGIGVVAVVAALAVLSGSAVAVGNGTQAGQAKIVTESTSFSTERGTQSVSGETNIKLTQELSQLTQQTGQYLARHSYRMPAEPAQLRVTVPEASTVRSAQGFIREDERTYRWDESSSRPMWASGLSSRNRPRSTVGGGEIRIPSVSSVRRPSMALARSVM